MNAGWYPDPNRPGWHRYWDGQQWTSQVSLDAQPYAQNLQPQPEPRYVSGLTTGQHVTHAILTVCTCGLWGIVWYSKAKLGRRRIS